MIQTLKELGIEGNFLNLKKDNYKKPMANIIVKCFFFKTKDNASMPTLGCLLAMQHCTRGSSYCSSQEKEVKGILTEKREVKILIFMDNIIQYG